jgi:hypothetical protein
MTDIPKIDDPVVAVILDRFIRFEKVVTGDLKSLNDRLDQIEKSNSAIANRAKGGYMVLLGLGTAASYFMGAFEWLAKFFRAH